MIGRFLCRIGLHALIIRNGPAFYDVRKPVDYICTRCGKEVSRMLHGPWEGF